MDCVVTNLSSSPVPIGDLYVTLDPATGARPSCSFSRASSDLPKMKSLMALLQAGTVTLTTTPTAAEIASGLLTAPASIQAADAAPVDAAVVDSPEILWRLPVPAGVGGSADDVAIFALNALPYKVRVMSVRGLVAANVAAATAAVRTQAAGAGTLIGTLDFGSLGAAALSNFNASVVLTPGSNVGLFVRRSNNTIGGEIFLGVRREN